MDTDKKITSHEIFRNSDILRRIFLNVANEQCKAFTISQNLINLIYVCKTWYRIATPILYSKIIYNGGITRGVFHGTLTRLETISKFIKDNKKQSDEYHLFNYINNIKEREECHTKNYYLTVRDNQETGNEKFIIDIDFTEEEEKQLNSLSEYFLIKIGEIIQNINSLKTSNDGVNTEEEINKVQKRNEQLFERIFYEVESNSNFKDNENLYRKYIEILNNLKNINLHAISSYPYSYNNNNNTLFIPDIYSNIKILIFNKTNQLRTVDQLYLYKDSFVDFVSLCKNLTVLSIGSENDKQHLVMEKDLLNIFLYHSFPHLRYLVFNNLQYITGETSFQYLPTNIEALRIDYCKNVTVDAIISIIRRIGPKLKLLSLKDGTITVDILNTILKYCRKLIYVDISYSKAEKDYIKKIFRSQVQYVIKINKNLRIFNVYGILDLKNIHKTEQLYPQVKLHNNENLRIRNQTMGASYNDNALWYNYLSEELCIDFRYTCGLPRPLPVEEEMEVIANEYNISMDENDSSGDSDSDSDILFV
ncbi:hypothetical protein U3516DRAFT_892710 [Neocallimastix sp. 'constans']|jgi:hypothetical protein